MLPESHYRASRQYHFIVEVCDSSEPVVEGVDVNTVQVEEVEADEAIVSMCATSSNPNLSTMKLKGGPQDEPSGVALVVIAYQRLWRFA